MKYFKDENDIPYAFNDDIEDIYKYPNTPEKLIEITEEEAKILSKKVNS